MKLKNLLLIAGMLFTITLHAETPLEQCMDNAMSQSAMDECAGKNYQLLDQQLNQVYHDIQVKYKNDPIFLNKLKIAEEAWIKFRDAQVNMKYPNFGEGNPALWYGYGSVFPMCQSNYLAELTQERIQQLKVWLNGMPEGDVCSGSIAESASS